MRRPQVLDYLTPWIDVYKVDLKSFDDSQYRKLGGRLQPILDTIRSLHRRGVWVEIVTLLVPGFNDSDEELTALTEFLASVSRDIPWHVTAFHQDYRMLDPAATTAAQFAAAAHGTTRGAASRVCGQSARRRSATSKTPAAQHVATLLVERYGYHIQGYHVRQTARARRASRRFQAGGIARFGGQITDHPFLPHDRTRRQSPFRVLS